MSRPYFVGPLGAKQRRELERLCRQPPNARVYPRALAVLLSAEGKTTREIGEIVRRCHSTVFRWLKSFDQRGVAACTPSKSPGRPPKVDADVKATLQEAVTRNPRDLGYPFTRWTTALLAKHVYATHHLALHSATVGDALRGLGYRYGCPKLDLANRQDSAEVARAKRQRNRALKKRPTAKDVSRSSTSMKRNSI
jgi:transposase